MTAIKPPGTGAPPFAGAPVTGTPDVAPGARVDRTSRARGGFADALDRAADTEPAKPVAAADWATELRTGRITRSEAIDRLVAQEVAKRQSAGLTPPGAEALARTIRTSLESDPAIVAMLDDVIRARE